MNAPLPPLRRTLEMMPSPVPESPGLLVRDPFDRNNAGHEEPDNLGQVLTLIPELRS